MPDLDQLPGMGDFFRMGGGAAAGADGQGGALPGLQDDLLPVPDGEQTFSACIDTEGFRNKLSPVPPLSLI